MGEIKFKMERCHKSKIESFFDDRNFILLENIYMEYTCILPSRMKNRSV